MSPNTRKVTGPTSISKRRFLWSLYTTELVLILLALIASRLFYGSYFPYHLEVGAGSILLGLFAAVPIGLAVFTISYGPLARLEWIEQAMSRMFEKLYVPFGRSISELSMTDIVLLSCAAGIGEELFFRGLVQSYAGLWWTALLFGLLHALTPFYFLLAAVIGVWFGLLYQYSDNLLVPILGHAAYDVFALVLLRVQFARR